VLQTLGNFYKKVGLNRPAEEHYRHALARSEQLHDVEGQALAQYALGRIKEAVGNLDEAVRHLDQAKAQYQQVGDAQMVEEIEQQLVALPTSK